MDTRVELEERHRKEQILKFQIFIIIALMIVGLSGLCIYCGYSIRVDQEDRVTDQAVRELQGDTVMIRGRLYKLTFEEIHGN